MINNEPGSSSACERTNSNRSQAALALEAVTAKIDANRKHITTLEEARINPINQTKAEIVHLKEEIRKLQEDNSRLQNELMNRDQEIFDLKSRIEVAGIESLNWEKAFNMLNERNDEVEKQLKRFLHAEKSLNSSLPALAHTNPYNANSTTMLNNDWGMHDQTHCNQIAMETLTSSCEFIKTEYDNPETLVDEGLMESNTNALGGVNPPVLSHILDTQNRLLLHVIDIKKGMKEIERNVEQLKQTDLSTTAMPHSSVQFKEVPVAPFQLIRTENDLIYFEDRLQNDQQFKNASISYLIGLVGNQMNKGKSAQDCAYLFDPLIFANSFWTLTAWTGGRSRKRPRLASDTEEPKEEEDLTDDSSRQRTTNEEDHLLLSRNDEEAPLKFHFSKHMIFRNFLTTLIYNVLNVIISTEEIKKYVQTKSKNAFYEPKTDRLSTTRLTKTKINKILFN